MKILFVKERLAWPRSSGHDVHTYYSMQAIARSGHAVGLVTLHELEQKAIEQSGVDNIYCLKTHPSTHNDQDDTRVQLTKTQERFRSYWGIEHTNILKVGKIAADFQADAVIVVGLNVLPYLGAVHQAIRIWYAGDEWVWHHLSQVQILNPASWSELKQAVIKGLYERAYAKMLDRVWMVTEADARAMRRVTGIREVDVLPNGVDTDYYQPLQTEEIPRSCVFWGRLDFGPNIQALQWFCRNVWSKLQSEFPDAKFSIYGFQPTLPVQRLITEYRGITLKGNLPDIRAEIAKHQVVVLPFISGGGIKNKLLEASALGKAILCTPRTVKGLSHGASIVSTSKPLQWSEALKSLWRDDDLRRKMGKAARAWVLKEHTWNSVAATAIAGIEKSLGAKAAG